MKSRRYSPRVSRLFLLSGVNDSPVVTQVVIKIPATLRTALSATSSWRMDRGWYLCHSSRLTRSHSMGLTLWTLESADHTYDSSDFRPPRATCKLRCEIVTVVFVVVVLTLLMMFIPVVIQWYDSDKCSNDQYCPSHMVTVPSLVLSLGWWNSYCWSLCPQSAPCLLLRSPTKNSHNKLSARLSTPPLDWVTALEPPPSLMPISAPLQKCAIFLWRVFELTATGRCWCSARWCLAAFCWSPLLRWQLLSTQLREMPADDRSQGWVSSDHQSSVISWSVCPADTL